MLEPVGAGRRRSKSRRPGPRWTRWRRRSPCRRPGRPVPYLERIEISFYQTEAALADALRAGEVDGAPGFSPAVSRRARDGDRRPRRLRYPTTTLSAVLLNLRPSHPELRDAAVRRALLAAIDRDALVAGALDGDATARRCARAAGLLGLRRRGAPRRSRTIRRPPPRC